VRHRIAILVSVGLAVGFLDMSCSRRQDRSGHQLVLTGSSTIAPLALEIAKRYEKAHEGLRVDVQSGGTSRGITDVRQSLADIGMVSRALYPTEGDLIPALVAMDGVCIILHASNPVRELRDADVVAIYRGEIKTWDKVGGPPEPITVVNKAEGRSTLELFLHYYKLAAKEIRAQVIIGENEQAIKTVVGNPNAIAYVSIGTAEYDAQHGSPIKLLPVGGVSPSTQAVAIGTYPLARALNFVTKGPPNDLARNFIAFAQSPAVADLVTGQHFVRPLK
jgi:phosphate transport system substrate-binding protein